jgi:glycosyltransferase involved in cell wall biosynthesis
MRDRDSAEIGSRHPEGGTRPWVLLASPDSLFPALLAEDWLRRGERVVCVHWSGGQSRLPDGVERLDATRTRRSLWDWALRVAEPAALAVQRAALQAGGARFTRVTGKSRPEPWEGTAWIWFANAWRIARTVRLLQPRLVFACEAMSYGFAARLCGPAPRVVFPFGADIYNSVETWRGADWMIGSALRKVDLVVPSATVAAEHLEKRLRVPSGRVKAISWGVDLDRYQVDRHQRAESGELRRLRGKWGLPHDCRVVTDCRRFRPHWGSRPVLEAMLRAAGACPQARFVLIGGPGASDEIAWAGDRLAATGLRERFLMLDREVTTEEYREIALMSDVGVSVVPRGDMRSSSVLEYAAAGAGLVLGENAEYRSLEPLGLRAQFARGDAPEELAAGILTYLRDDKLLAAHRDANRAYVERHENRTVQFQRLWDELTALVDIRERE